MHTAAQVPVTFGDISRFNSNRDSFYSACRRLHTAYMLCARAENVYQYGSALRMCVLEVQYRRRQKEKTRSEATTKEKQEKNKKFFKMVDKVDSNPPI